MAKPWIESQGRPGTRVWSSLHPRLSICIRGSTLPPQTSGIPQDTCEKNFCSSLEPTDLPLPCSPSFLLSGASLRATVCQACAVHLDCKLAPEGGGSDLGRVGMLLDATAVDINIFSFSSVTLGDSGYLIAQMCWGFCQWASQPLPDCHWSRAHTFIPPPTHTAHPGGTQAERA